jgi:hypothetical protein
MVETRDISIGQDKWIKWIELDPNDKDEFDIDPSLELTKQFWANLEINCVAGCCGIDAFSFWPEDIKQASKGFDKIALRAQLDQLKEDVIRSNIKIVVSERLNNLFDKRVLIELVNHIIRHL